MFSYAITIPFHANSVNAERHRNQIVYKCSIGFPVPSYAYIKAASRPRMKPQACEYTYAGGVIP